MNKLPIIFAFATIFSFCSAGEHILRLEGGIHAGTTLIGVEEGSSVSIRCEHPNGKVESLRWLHGGTNMKPEYIKRKSDASYIEILEYHAVTDDGVYECSAPGMSASYRLKAEKTHALPDGFRYCFGEEMADCVHAEVCQVDMTSQLTSCVCEKGWMGAACDNLDSVSTHPIVTPPICAYWPPIVTLIVFIIVIVLLAYCLHKFKVRRPRYSKYTTTLSATNNNNNDKPPPMVSGQYTAVRQIPPGSSNLAINIV